MPVLDAAENIAREYGCTISQVALAWFLSRKDVSSMIIGVEKLQQFIDNIQVLQIKLTVDDIRKLEEAGEPLKKLTESTTKRK